MTVLGCLRAKDRRPPCFFFFFFNDTATTEIYTLSLHDALPIYELVDLDGFGEVAEEARFEPLLDVPGHRVRAERDRSEERREGKSVDLGGRRIIKKKNHRARSKCMQDATSYLSNINNVMTTTRAI